MMKRSLIALFLTLAVLLATGSSCLAEIIPAQGEGQIGLQAVVLCESLALRQERSASSKTVKTLRYGEKIIVTNQVDGWAECFLTDSVDGERAGYVSTEYLIIDPAWYRTDASTPVYSRNDTTAPKVALLKKGVSLPILWDEGDWLIVSLRGATGWIQKTSADQLSVQTNEMVQSFGNLKRVKLETSKGNYTLTERASLKWIEENFSIAKPVTETKCVFNATLTLTTADAKTIKLEVATDGCPNFRTEDGNCFAFGGAEASGEEDSDPNISEAFWNLFGLSANDINE